MVPKLLRVAAICLGLPLALAIAGHAATVSVAPDTTYAERVFQNIAIDITVQQVDSMAAIACDIQFDPSLLEFVGITEGDFMRGAGVDSTATALTYSEVPGTITVGLSQLGMNLPGRATEVAATLFSLEFKVLDYGISQVSLLNASLLKPDGMTEIAITTENGAVEAAYPTMTSTMLLDPTDTTVYLLDPVVVRLTVDSVRWLHGFAADLRYPPAMLRLDSVVEGSAMSASGQIATAFAYDNDQNAGVISVGGSILSQGDTGVSVAAPQELATFYFTGTAIDSGRIAVTDGALIAPNGTAQYPVAQLGGCDVTVHALDDSTAVVCEPADTVVYQTQAFRLAVAARTASCVSAYSLDFGWDPEVMRIDSIAEGPIFNSQGHQTYFDFEVDTLFGSATCGGAILSAAGACVTADVPVPIAYVFLTARGPGTGSLNIQNVGLFARDGVTTYPVAVTGGTDVTVLPTTELVLRSTGPEGSDASVYASSPATNFGSDTVLSTGSGSAEALLKFNLSALDSTALVSSASLSMYRFGGTSTDALVCYEAGAIWNAGTVTWNTRPDTGLRVSSAFADTGWHGWTVTGSVQSWLITPSANNGFVVAVPSGTGDDTRFFSGDYTTDSMLRPELTVNYYYAPSCPDLLPAAGIALSPDPIVEGDTAAIAVDIYNTGLAGVSNVLVRFYDGVPLLGQYVFIGETTLPYVPGYGYATASMAWPTADRTGDRTIFVSVNPDHAVAECDTLNNRHSYFTHVAAKADLRSDCSHLHASTATPVEGEVVQFDLIVSNSGEAAAAGFLTVINLVRPGGVVVALDSTIRTAALAQDASDTIHFEWNTAGYPGNGDIRVSIDAGGAVREQSETNNQFSCPVTVYNPNLVVTAECPADAGPNDTVQFTYRLSNNSVVAAHGVVTSVAVPAGLLLLAESVPSDSGFPLRWSLDSLSGGQTAEITLSLQVQTSLAPGSIVDIAGQTTFNNAFGLNPTLRSVTTSLTIGEDVTPPQVLVSVAPNLVGVDTVAIVCTPSEALLSAPTLLVVAPGADTLSVLGPAVENLTYTFEVPVDSSVPNGQVQVVVSVEDLAGNLGQSVTYFQVDHVAPGATLSLGDTLSLGVHDLVLTANEALAGNPAISAVDSVGNPIAVTFASRQGLTYHYSLTVGSGTARGPALITVPLIDLVGNDSVLTDSFYVMNLQPVITVAMPTLLPLGTTSFTVSVNRPLAGVPTVAAYDHLSIAMKVTGPAVLNNTYTYNLKVDSATAQGSANLHIGVTDIYGNAADSTVAFTVDRLSPTLSVVPNNSALAGTYTMWVRSSEQLAGAPQVLPYGIYGQAETALVSDSAVNDTLYRYPGVSTGVTSFAVTGADLAGNTATAVQPYCDFDVRQDQIAFSTQPMGGNDVTITAWIHNRGVAPADSVPVEIWRGYPGYGLMLGSTQWASIAAADSIMVSVLWPIADQQSSYAIFVSVDRQKRITEQSEMNNTAWVGSIGLFSYTNKSSYLLGLDSVATVYCSVVGLTTGQILSDSIASVTANLQDTSGNPVVVGQALSYDPSSGYFRWDFNPTAMLDQGVYRFCLFANAGGPAAAASDTIEFRVYRGLNIQCASAEPTYYRRDTIRIMGQVTYSDAAPVAYAAVSTRIKNAGGTRTIQSTTDASGAFIARLVTHPLEAGNYTAICEAALAGHLFADTTTFTIQGLLITPTDYALTMSQNSMREVAFSLKNIGTEAISFDSILVRDSAGAPGLTTYVDDSQTAGTINSGQTTTLTVEVTASPTAINYAVKYLDVYFNDSLSERANLRLTAQTARPFITGTPGSPEFYLSPGATLTKQIRVINSGFTAWRDIEPQTQLPSWLSIRLPVGLDSLAAGAQFTFEATATAGASGVPGIYDTTYTFHSSNYQDVTFPIRLYVTDTTTGTLRFVVVSEAGDSLTDAEVYLYSQNYDPITHTYPVFHGYSGAGGICDFVDLPAGPYTYRITKENFVAATGPVTVAVGQTIESTETVVLEPQAITVNWTVQDTTIDDAYNVTVDITYNTSVPFLVISPHVMAHAGEIGEDIYDSFTITNLGERPADVVTLDWPSSAFFSVEMLGNEPAALADGIQPGESVEVPYHLAILLPLPSCMQTTGWLTVTGSYDDNGFSGSVQSFGQFLIAPGCGGLRVDPPVIFTVDVPCILDNSCECDPAGIFYDIDDLVGTNVTSENMQLGPIVSGELRHTLIGLPIGDVLGIVQAGIQGAGFGYWDSDYLSPAQSTTGHIVHLRLLSLGLSVSGGAAYIPFELAESGPGWRLIPIIRIGLSDLGISDLLSCLPFNINQDYVNPSCPTCVGGGGWGGGIWDPSFRPIPMPPDVPEDQGGIVRLRLNQRLCLERQAFSGTLELINGFDTYAVEDLDVNIEVADSNGLVLATDQYDASSPLFFASPQLTGVGDVNGQGTIVAGDSASANWLIIPKTDAGGTAAGGRVYQLSAVISYTINGQEFSYRTPAEDITVLPQPKLDLTYFLPSAVEADRPFTMSLLVHNGGAGVAHDLSIDSDQPIVLDGAEFLDRFEIIAAGVGTELQDPSMFVNLGDLTPGSSAMARWLINASPSGTIDEFTASFTHSDALGGHSTSLVNSVSTSRIMRASLRYGSGLGAGGGGGGSWKDAAALTDDFIGILADAGEDGHPDAVYDLITGESFNVDEVQPDSIDGPSYVDPVMNLYFGQTDAWLYVKVSDPFLGTKTIGGVTREDGTLVPDYNYWTDSSFVYICDAPYGNRQYSVQFNNLAYKPDLLIESDSIAFIACSGCGTIDAGDTSVVVSFAVQNSGLVAAGRTPVYLYDGQPSIGPLIDSAIVDSVPAGGSVRASVVWHTGPGPEWVKYYHRVYVAADPFGTVTEVTADNNQGNRGVDFPLTTGDVDHDGFINLSDITYEIAWVFQGGSTAIPPRAGEVNCDDRVNIVDIIYLVNYLFRAGPEPCDPRLPGQKLVPAPAYEGDIQYAVTQLSPTAFRVDVAGSLPAALAGVQQVIVSEGGLRVDSVRLASATKDLSVFWGAVSDTIRIGLLDPSGQHYCPAGDHDLMELFVSRLNRDKVQPARLRWIESIGADTNAELVDLQVADPSVELIALPTEFMLRQNYPNPFNPTTVIDYGLPRAAHVKLTIYNILGQEVRTLVDGWRDAGYYSVEWDGVTSMGNQAATGVYLYRITAGDFVQSKKMVLIR